MGTEERVEKLNQLLKDHYKNQKDLEFLNDPNSIPSVFIYRRQGYSRDLSDFGLEVLEQLVLDAFAKVVKDKQAEIAAKLEELGVDKL